MKPPTRGRADDSDDETAGLSGLDQSLSRTVEARQLKGAERLGRLDRLGGMGLRAKLLASVHDEACPRLGPGAPISR
jgi:hypothetical protein